MSSSIVKNQLECFDLLCGFYWTKVHGIQRNLYDSVPISFFYTLNDIYFSSMGAFAMVFAISIFPSYVSIVKASLGFSMKNENSIFGNIFDFIEFIKFLTILQTNA